MKIKLSPFKALSTVPGTQHVVSKGWFWLLLYHHFLKVTIQTQRRAHKDRQASEGWLAVQLMKTLPTPAPKPSEARRRETPAIWEFTLVPPNPPIKGFCLPGREERNWAVTHHSPIFWFTSTQACRNSFFLSEGKTSKGPDWEDAE